MDMCSFRQQHNTVIHIQSYMFTHLCSCLLVVSRFRSTNFHVDLKKKKKTTVCGFIFSGLRISMMMIYSYIYIYYIHTHLCIYLHVYIHVYLFIYDMIVYVYTYIYIYVRYYIHLNLYYDFIALCGFYF